MRGDTSPGGGGSGAGTALNNANNLYRRSDDSPDLDSSPRESRDRERDRDRSDRYQSSSYMQKMKERDRDRDYKKDKYTGNCRKRD